MRKFLLSAIALLMTATMLAVGNGSGKSQANAIDFDWDGELFHGAGNTSWYCIKLSELNKDVDDPTVAIYLTNPGNEMAHVELTGSAVLRFPYPLSLFVGDIDLLELAGTDATQTYDIAGKKHVVWTMPTAYDLSGISDPKIRKALADAFGDLSNVSLVQLVEFGLPSVDLKVYSTQQIVIAADVYETSEIVDDACTKADDFDWAGETVAAGETWFYLDLNAVKNSDKKLNFVVENNGANDANVSFDLYADCPASAILLDYDWAILSGDEVTEALGRFFLDQMTRDYVYLKLTTDQSVTLKAEEEVLPPPVELFNPSTAPQLEIGKEYSLHGETVLQVNLAALKAPKGYKTVCHVVNPNGVDVNLKQEIAYTTPVTSNNVRVINLPVAAGAALEINVPNKNIENVKSDVVYFRLTTAEPLTLVMEHEQLESSKPVDPSKPSTPAIMAPTCEDSYAFDWNSSIKQKALMTKWYELDITSLKKNEEHVQLSFTNHTESVVVVMGSILSDCNSKDTIPFVCPVPAGMQISKVIDYSLLATSPISKAYVSLTMMPTTAKSLADFASVRSQADLMNMISLDFSAEIEVKAKRISALVDPSYCEATYQTLKEGVEYHIEPGKTHWYRVTGDFLKDMGLLEKLTIFNNGKSDANVTLGATIDCQYGIATTITQTVPKWFDVTSCYPSGFYQLARLLTKKEITEYYLSVKSDQPMLFGFGLDHGTMLGCDDALRFDWAKGATINRLDPQWFNFDLNDVKGTGNHLKLTFTNTTDEIVWLATMTSLTCPLKVVAPTVMPVLPGMSVDKVIDYSFVATTPVNNVYVAVIASGKLELGAKLIDATVTEPVDCINHVEVVSGEKYIHKPGTTWYKFSNALLANMGEMPRFTFENLSANTITLSAGMTVDCKYGILTKAKAKIPATVFGKPIHNREFAMRIPREFFQLVRKHIDSDVTELMFQLTADNPFSFSINMQADNACANAETFGWKGCYDLPANQDVWYQVNVAELMASNKPISVALYNKNKFPVEIEAELAPSCPVLFSVTEYYTAPALDSVKVTVSAKKIQSLLGEYSKYINNGSTCYVRLRAKGDLTTCLDTVPPTAPDVDTPCQDVIVEDTVVACNSYVWHGTTYKASGVYTYEETTANCEEAEVLDWSQPIKLSEFTEPWYKVCVAEVIANESDFSMTFDNDMETTDLTLELHYFCSDDNDGFANSITKTVAPGLYTRTITWDEFDSWIGTEYDTLYLHNVNADCKNIEKLHLTINKTVSTRVTETACGQYEWNGKVYTKSGSYKDTLVAANGCDSIVTLRLTVNPVVETVMPTETETICASDLPYAWRDTVCAAAGTYTSIEEDGCNRTVYTLTLNVLDGADATYNMTETICADKLPYTWSVGKGSVVFDAAGTKQYFDPLECGYTATYNLTLNVDACTPPTPQDPCLSAIAVEWDDVVVVPADADVWYAVDITTAIAAGKDVKLTVKNTSSEDTKVYVEAYSDCPATDFLGEMNATIKAGQTREMVIDYAKWLDGQVDLIYMHVVTVGGSVDAEATPITPVVPPTPQDPCLSAIAVDWTDAVTVPANADVWYAVDITTAIAAGKDVKLTVKNTSSEDTKVYVEAYSDCPATDFLGEMNATIKAGKTREIVIDYAKWLDGQVDVIYMHVVTVGGSLDAEATPVTPIVPPTPQDPCLSAIAVNWDDEVTVPANADVWYAVDITTAIAAGKDVKLTVKNTSSEDTKVYVEAYSDCPATDFLGEMNATIKAGKTREMVIDYAKWLDGQVDLIYVHVVTVGGSLDAEATPVDCYEYKTITDYICDGATYVDPVTGEARVISSLIASTQTWNDTVVTGKACDSIYSFVITPIVAPEEMTVGTLNAIGAAPVLKVGSTVDVTGTVEAIKAYYEANDTEAIADVVNVTWIAGTDATLTCENTTHSMVLFVEAGCDFEITTTLTFPVEDANEYAEYTETACDKYVWHGETYTASGDYTFTTTTAAGCERVEVLHLTINKTEEVEYTETACDEYVWHGETYTTSGDYTYEADCRKEILHLTINKSEYEEYTETACDEYVWHGETYTASGDYTYTTTTAAGCERVEVLHLTINKSEYEEYTETACDEYVWHGETYTESGDYTYTTTTASGCERVEVLHLTINKSEYEEYTETACDEYVWHGETYTESGDYTYTTTTAAGCERVEVLHLTINKSEYEEYTETACDEYVWHGETYTASGDYTYTTTTAAGCERVEVLHLTINKSEYEEYTESACESYVWHGETYTESGDYTYTTTTAAGCERVEVLHLTINVPTEGSETINLCPGETYTWNGDTYDKAGTYTTTLTNAAGCDSVATLVITIPDADNFVDYDNVPAVSKYGNRLLVINLNAVDSLFGWVPAESDVQWFKINGAVDAAIDAINRKGDDEYVGNGYYYNFMDGSSLVDDYYALILHQALEGDCQEILRTTILSSSAAKQAPQLLPTIANPYNNLRVLNLNPSAVSEIRVYNTTGELLEVYTSTQASEFILKAASMPGYYMVEVQAEGDKATLRYIVK